jgi:hypothetical protein
MPEDGFIVGYYEYLVVCLISIRQLFLKRKIDSLVERNQILYETRRVRKFFFMRVG